MMPTPKSIGELPLAGTLNLTELMEIEQGGLSARVALSTVVATRQPVAANLTNYAALTLANNTLSYTDGTGTLTTAPLTTFGLSLLDAANAGAARSALGLAIGSDVQAYSANLASIAALTTTAFGNSLLTISGGNSKVLVTDSGGIASMSSTLPAVSGANLTSLNGSNVSSGTVADARIDAAIARLASPTFTGTVTIPTVTSSDNSQKGASTAFVATAISNAFTNVLTFKGNLDCSANPNYPAGVVGDQYVVNVAGKIGGGSGTAVDSGDTVTCKATNAGGTQGSVGADWFINEHNLVGAVLAANNLSDLTSVATALTNLGGTTSGKAIFKLVNPGAISFIQINADNSATALSASAFRTAIGASDGTLSVGKILFVDLVNGNDGTGVRGNAAKPYLKPSAAQAAAMSGDTIVVYPGTYVIDAPLGKNGVNWNLLPGAVLNAVTETSVASIFTDGGVAMTFSVYGFGDLLFTGVSGDLTPNGLSCVIVSNPSSDVRVVARTISMQVTNGGDTVGGAVVGNDGRLWVTADLIEATGGGEPYTIWWLNGDMRVKARRISVSASSGGSAIKATVSTTPTGECYIDADEILATSNAGVTPAIVSDSPQAEAKLWLRGVSLIRCFAGPAIAVTGGKFYLQSAAKIVANSTSGESGNNVVDVAGGLFWMTAHKITATYGYGLGISGGTAEISLLEVEDLGNMAAAINVSGGTLYLRDTVATMAVGQGLMHSGGTAILMNCRLDTSAVSGEPTVSVSSSGLTLSNCFLAAEGTQDTLFASSSQTVTVNGNLTANRPFDVNITTVDGVVARTDLGHFLHGLVVLGADGSALFGNGFLTISKGSDLTYADNGGTVNGVRFLNGDSVAVFSYANGSPIMLGQSNTSISTSDNSGYIAGNNIFWDASGNITFKAQKNMTSSGITYENTIIQSPSAAVLFAGGDVQGGYVVRTAANGSNGYDNGHSDESGFGGAGFVFATGLGGTGDGSGHSGGDGGNFCVQLGGGGDPGLEAPAGKAGSFIIQNNTLIDGPTTVITLGADGSGLFKGGVICTDLSPSGTIAHTGTTLGFYSQTPVARPTAFTVSNSSSNRTLNVTSVTLTQLANVVATMIADDHTLGLRG